jgi:hypothetical protein
MNGSEAATKPEQYGRTAANRQTGAPFMQVARFLLCI